MFNLDGDEVRSQAQIKIRPRVTNNGASSLSIDITPSSAIRLVVAGSDLPRAWKPPVETLRGGDRPNVISYGGQHYWGVPPNVPHDARLLHDGTGYTGFATEWSATKVAPGSSYFVPLAHQSDGSPIQDGDLVFQIPQDDRIIGLAVVTRNRTPTVLGFQSAQTWPASSDPASF